MTLPDISSSCSHPRRSHRWPMLPSSLSHYRFVVVAGVACALVSLAHPCRAQTDTAIGLALNVNDALPEGQPGTGFGLDATVGPRLDLVLLELTTELSAGLHSFSGDGSPLVSRAMVGGNIGLGAIIRPSVFAHLGVGHVQFSADAENDQTQTNWAGDVGLALDLTLLPLVDLGIQGSYNAIAKQSDVDAFRWFQTGIHATLVF